MIHKGQLLHHLIAYYREEGEAGPRPSEDLNLIGKVLNPLAIGILLLPVLSNETRH
jgi:hypothetical protein